MHVSTVESFSVNSSVLTGLHAHGRGSFLEQLDLINIHLRLSFFSVFVVFVFPSAVLCSLALLVSAPLVSLQPSSVALNCWYVVAQNDSALAEKHIQSIDEAKLERDKRSRDQQRQRTQDRKEKQKQRTQKKKKDEDED